MKNDAAPFQRVQDTVDELLAIEEGSALNAAEYIQIGSMSKTSKRDDLFTVPFIVPLLGHGNIVMSVSGEGCISDGVVREVEAKTLYRLQRRKLKSLVLTRHSKTSRLLFRRLAGTGKARQRSGICIREANSMPYLTS